MNEKQKEAADFLKLAKFQEKQLEAWYVLMSDKCKYLLYGGAAGGGKSYFLRWAAIGLAMYYYGKYKIDHIPIGLFSEDYPTLRDRQITKIAREFPSWLGVLKETKRDGLAFHLFPDYGEGVIMLRNLDDSSKYASVEFTAILVEELTKNQDDTFEDLRTRLRYPGIEDRKFIGATNPGQVGHGWVKRKWVKVDATNLDAEQDRFYYVPARFTDNKYNPEDYDLQLQAIRDPQKRKALMDGSWDAFVGQYFEEWNDYRHVIHPFVPHKNSPHSQIMAIVGGLDWGRAKPFSFHLATVEKVYWEEQMFYRVRTFYEAYGIQKNPEEWSNQIKTELAERFSLTLADIDWVRGDIIETDAKSVTIKDQFVSADARWGKILNAADKTQGAREAGWSVMHDWLSTAPDNSPYWQIASNCTNLIRTLPDAVHDENKVEDVDSQGEDHAIDDQRYMLKHIKFIQGYKGIISSKRHEAKVESVDNKFFRPADDAGQLMVIDSSKFK